MADTYNARRKLLEFSKGDKVWRKMDRGSRLFKKRTGPFDVVGRGEQDGNYIIKHPDQTVEEVHESELLPYLVEYANPEDPVLESVTKSICKERAQEVQPVNSSGTSTKVITQEGEQQETPMEIDTPKETGIPEPDEIEYTWKDSKQKRSTTVHLQEHNFRSGRW